MASIHEGRAILAEVSGDSFAREQESRRIILSVLNKSYMHLFVETAIGPEQQAIDPEIVVYRQARSDGPVPIVLAGYPKSFRSLAQSEVMCQNDTDFPGSSYTSLSLEHSMEPGKRFVIGKTHGIENDFTFPNSASLHVIEHGILSVTPGGDIPDDTQTFTVAWSIVFIGLRAKSEEYDNAIGSINICIPEPLSDSLESSPSSEPLLP